MTSTLAVPPTENGRHDLSVRTVIEHQEVGPRRSDSQYRTAAPGSVTTPPGIVVGSSRGVSTAAIPLAG